MTMWSRDHLTYKDKQQDMIMWAFLMHYTSPMKDLKLFLKHVITTLSLSKPSFRGKGGQNGIKGISPSDGVLKYSCSLPWTRNSFSFTSVKLFPTCEKRAALSSFIFDGSCMDERELSGWSWQPHNSVTEQSSYHSAIRQLLKSHKVRAEMNDMKSRARRNQ